jgi:ligand-binding SRPBCC domain-containing protein
MIRTAEIRRSDISVREKFIACVYEQETTDSPRSCVDVATANSVTRLSNWAHSHVLSHNPDVGEDC